MQTDGGIEVANWKDRSREDWQTRAENSREFIREDVKLGCLQRIAESLERIADLLDPGKQRQKEEASKTKELWDKRHAWNARGRNLAIEIFEKKLRRYFGKLQVGGKDLRYPLVKCFEIPFWFALESLPPCEEAERDLMVEKCKEFEPSQFDWLSLYKLGSRGRLGMFAALKEIGHTVGMPKEEAQP